MGSLIYHLLSSATLSSLGIYRLISTTINHHKSPPHTYSAKPYHPLNNLRFKHLPLYLLISSLLIAFLRQTLISSDPDPLLKGGTPFHRFTSLHSAALLFLFLILTLAILVSEIAPSVLPFPSDLFFGLAAALFYLHYSLCVATADGYAQIRSLQAKCDTVSGTVSALASILSLILAIQPRLFVADVGLGGAIVLQGLWQLQTGLSLYVDAFIPEGCHKMLDVVNGVDGSTQCDLDESRMRAVAILDLMFVVHVMFVVVLVFGIYAVVAKTVAGGGGGIRRFGGSYEALPTLTSSTAGAAAETNHSVIQMKSLTGTQA